MALKNKLKISPLIKKAEAPNAFTVVAIGASAGGLEAITAILKHLPSDTGMAYIYVQHLSPDHKSLLTAILSKITKMKVQEIEDMESIQPNNIYVIPPDKGLEVTDGHIKLLPRSKSKANTHAIDRLFTSLAATHHANVIGIILSGYGNDGMLGINAIKAEGGITIAQDKTAQESGMPQAAIKSGCIDFILSPKAIAERLIKYGKDGLISKEISQKSLAKIAVNTNNHLNAIFELLLRSTGVDFSHYKLPTIKRRLAHKMGEHGIKTMGEFYTYLNKKPNEIKSLYFDLLINVTNFFRDIEVFNYLKNNFLPKLLKSKSTEDAIRIWIPACSTGQEAYSIAILIAELQEQKITPRQIQIFATDLSEDVISKARTGNYSESEVKNVPKKYLKKYFTKSDAQYTIVKPMRDQCIFASHNILLDPPFSRMDFISCRNLLIYFDVAAQKKVFASLHFALNDNGYLMLGKAETINNALQLYTRVNDRFRLYSRKKNSGILRNIELTPRFPRTLNIYKTNSPIMKTNQVHPTGIESATDAYLLSNYMPACVVVNKDLDILQFRGPVSIFLNHPPGKASLNVLKMTRPEFAFELRNAMTKAIKTKATVKKSDIEITVDGVLQKMSFEVSHLKIEWDEPLLLIVFTLHELVEVNNISDNKDKNTLHIKDKRIKKLLDELNTTRSEMNSIIEAQEVTFEELQAANEEIVSSNEEFQTLNEELETSKEEIEATNEELIHTNQELQVRNDMLTEANEYSETIITTAHEPLLVLQSNFKIKSANKSFYETFKINNEAVEGQSFFEIGNKKWHIPALKKALENTLKDNLGFENFEVNFNLPEIGNRIMLLNAHTIQQKTNGEQLILLAIEDITERSKYYIKEQYALSLIEASLDPLFTINSDGEITDLNEATSRIIGLSRQKIMHTKFEDYFSEKEHAKKVYGQVFKKQNVASYPMVLKHKNGKLSNVLLNGSIYKDEKGLALGVVIVARNIDELKKSKDKFKSIIELAPDAILIINKLGEIEMVNSQTEKLFENDRSHLIGEKIKILIQLATNETKLSITEMLLKAANKNQATKNLSAIGIGKNGRQFPIEISLSKIVIDDKLMVSIAIRDVSIQQKNEQELIEARLNAELAKSKAENATNSKQQFLSNMSHEIRTPLNAIIGFTKVIMKTDLSTNQKEYLSAIKVSGDALIVLINDILDLAKVDAGKMVFEKNKFSMLNSVNTMSNLFKTKIEEQNLQFVKIYDDKIPSVVIGDPVRLHQIILNLLSNAIKFTKKGKIGLAVRMVSETNETATIGFNVSDTGIGIAENKLQGIFENFQQATTRTSRIYGGTGLGLAISKQLVEAQGGSIQVESKLNSGSNFYFELQFQKSNDALMEENNEKGQFKSKQAVHILVVEDIALNQLLMKTILTDFGFTCDFAKNGRVAIEQLKTNTYQLILMDLQMPVMDGYEATQYIREKLKLSIPIIALTADVTSVDSEVCHSFGMNDFIAKPADEKVLFNKIIQYISEKIPSTVQIPPKNKTSFVNLSALKKRTIKNTALLEDIIQLFIVQTPLLLASMALGCKEGNWEMVYSSVHKLIPSLSAFGMDPSVEKRAKEIQAAAHNRTHLETIPALISNISETCELALLEILIIQKELQGKKIT